MSSAVLALNAGSSTLKYTLYRCDEQGEHEILGDTLRVDGRDWTELLDTISQRIAPELADRPLDVGHRVVHGGEAFTEPVQVDASVLTRLQALIPLAPLHLPPALELLRHARELFERSTHVACFDTAFHSTLPDVARRFALPAELHAAGIRRYGFHGLSYEYVVSTFGTAPPSRLVVAHLGSGASMAAIQNGRSIDTTMGLTPSGGIPMGTRTGDLDPGVLLHLCRERGMTAEQLEQLVNHDSGLKGLAGSAQMTELLARDDAQARGAVELFGYAIRKQIGAYAAALGGLDCLVFTGGIGEHAPRVRELACRDLAALGIELDPERNRRSDGTISRDGSTCAVRVLATDEDLMIARKTRGLARALRA